MFSQGILKYILFIICAICMQITHSQEIRVIDNKGTLKTANNNSVTSSETQPSFALEGDIWFDTSTTPTLIKVYNDSNWVNLTNTGTKSSVFFAAANGLPTENNSQLFWNNTSNTLQASNIQIPGKLLDSNGGSGTVNQVLTATTVGTKWALAFNKVENELIFDGDDDTNPANDNYRYVSLKINEEWQVIRYNKTDVNIEHIATFSNNPGQTTQPTTLATCTALTYN